MGTKSVSRPKKSKDRMIKNGKVRKNLGDNLSL